MTPGMAVTAEMIGGPLDGTVRVFAEPVPSIYAVLVQTLGTREQINRGELIIREARYRLKIDEHGVPWFTPNAQRHYDWEGWSDVGD